MDATQLREMQAPFKTLYREQPEQAKKVLHARGEIVMTDLVCRVETPVGIASAGLHPATGGDPKWACSGDMLLQSLVACAGVTLCAVAMALEIPLRGGEVIAEGDLDFRGTLGVSKEVPIGFEAIRLKFRLETDAPKAKIESLIKLTERYCVISQSLKNPPKQTIEWST